RGYRKAEALRHTSPQMCHDRDRDVMSGETTTPTVGLSPTLIHAPWIVWLYARQPQTVAQFTGGLSAAVGAYHIDGQSFADGRGFFRAGGFRAAPAALQ